MENTEKGWNQRGKEVNCAILLETLLYPNRRPENAGKDQDPRAKIRGALHRRREKKSENGASSSLWKQRLQCAETLSGNSRTPRGESGKTKVKKLRELAAGFGTSMSFS